MIKIIAVTEYNKTVADRIRQLLIQLSRSGKDKGEISQEWFEQLISSPWHDLLLAVESAEEVSVVGCRTVVPIELLGSLAALTTSEFEIFTAFFPCPIFVGIK